MDGVQFALLQLQEAFGSVALQGKEYSTSHSATEKQIRSCYILLVKTRGKKLMLRSQKAEYGDGALCNH